MKIVVTGGAGFIGRHLAVSLLKAGNEVTIYDNLKNASKHQVSRLREDGIKFVKGDITDYKLLSRAISGSDSVIHLAAQIDVQESIRNPVETHHINATGTVTLLRACVAHKVRNVIAASTAAVYGDQRKQPVYEYSHVHPISPYGASKLVMEYYMETFSKCYGLNCISLRLFNLYGKGQSSAYAGVITKFTECIQHNKPLVIFGNGMNTRDFVSVKDVVQAVQIALKRIQGKTGNVYNVGSGKHTTIKQLAKLMISISGKKLSIKYTKPMKGEIRKSQPSIQLARRELGYHPKIDLKEGLRELIGSGV